MYPKEQNAIDVDGKGYVQDITDWNEDSIGIWKDCIHSVSAKEIYTLCSCPKTLYDTLCGPTQF